MSIPFSASSVQKCLTSLSSATGNAQPTNESSVSSVLGVMSMSGSNVTEAEEPSSPAFPFAMQKPLRAGEKPCLF